MKKKQEAATPVDRTVYLEQNMETVMHDSMIPYAEHVILERAIPRVEDGLKPVQRRVLYTMYEQGLTPDKPFRKSANIVGECMARYHPHGDSSIYETMVRMAQDFNMRTPLVEGNGNFGSMDGDTAAAFRYTEARLAPPALAMMSYLDRDAVPFSLNFDDTRREPDVLPALFPNLLVNGTGGIAVGLATSIPTHRAEEVIDGAVAILSHPRLPLEELMALIPGPDFPTGGVIVNGEALPEIYRTGAGRLCVRARAHTEKDADGKPRIVITEFPYQTNKAELLARILEHAQSKKEIIAQITDIRDESDRTGVRAVIELKRGCDAARMLEYLYKYTDLQKTVAVNMVAIADGKPRQMGLVELLRSYVDFRCELESRRAAHDLTQAQAREEILVGLVKAAHDIDRVIAIIRGSRTPAVAREALCRELDLTDRQADAILEMKLRRVTGLEVETLEKEQKEVRAVIDRESEILSSKAKLHAAVRASLSSLKKEMRSPRRTEIREGEAEVTITRDAFKTVEDTVVYFDEYSCLHRVTPKAFDNLQKTAPLPEERYLRTRTDATLLLFGGRGMCYQLAADAVPDNKPKGTIPEKLISGFDDGSLLLVYPFPDAKNKDKLIFATADGQIKVSEATEYAVRRNKFDALSLREGDRLLYAGVKKYGWHIAFETEGGKERVYRSLVEPTGRKTKGVRAFKGTFVKATQTDR